MDIGEVLLAAGAGQAAKDTVTTMLNPSAEYLGQVILKGVKAPENFARVCMNAARKLGSRINEEDGRVPPRVLKEILAEAPYCEDELMAEYLGGVLASSWSGRTRDDRGVSLLSIIRGMSSYALRAHFILYSCLRLEYKNLDVKVTGGLEPLGIYMPFGQFNGAMAVAEGEDFGDIVNHVMGILPRLDLISLQAVGQKSILQTRYPSVPADGMVILPTLAGIELYLWATGNGNKSMDYFLDPGLEVGSELRIAMAYGVQKVSKIQRSVQPDESAE